MFVSPSEMETVSSTTQPPVHPSVHPPVFATSPPPPSSTDAATIAAAAAAVVAEVPAAVDVQHVDVAVGDVAVGQVAVAVGPGGTLDEHAHVQPHGQQPLPAPVSDIVREYLAEVRRGAPHDARRYHESCEIAFVRKPATLQQATDALELARLSNSQCKVMLSAMNVTGCKNSCLAAKKYILACKMVQRQVALQALFDITSRLGLVPAHEQRADGGTPDAEVARIKSLPKTSAAAEPPRPGQEVTELVNWARGDIPVFVDTDIVIGEPPIQQQPPATLEEAAAAGPIKTEVEVVKRPVGRPRSIGLEDDRPARRRRVTTGDVLATNNQPDNELFIKEAEAQSAGARAVQDTLKAIKDTEEVLNACAEDDLESKAFYRNVIDTLRKKMASILEITARS